MGRLLVVPGQIAPGTHCPCAPWLHSPAPAGFLKFIALLILINCPMRWVAIILILYLCKLCFREVK